jgi:hypothetical protein
MKDSFVIDLAKRTVATDVGGSSKAGPAPKPKQPKKKAPGRQKN